MNIELAKQLKDAGFPQGGKGNYKNEYGLGIPPANGFPLDGEYGNFVYIPTLSELIEACVEMNHDWTISLENTRDEVWWSEMWHFGERIGQVDGSTLEVSVARLWLKLNEK